ncbi:MAG: CDP-alcohol phosphatidyltransferase family protein [Sphingobacteriales bacterium]
MKYKIPLLLIYSRIVFAILIILLAVFKVDFFRGIIIAFVVLGLLSDIFDGIIARRLNISTQKLRRLDSSIDQIFWGAILVSTYIVSPKFFKANLILILIVVLLEVACYVISFIRFKKEVATHAIASKIWTLVLFAMLLQVIATGNSVILFYICFSIGVVTRLEIILILFILKDWTNDVPTVYHAVLIKKGKEIKRHKLFNG